MKGMFVKERDISEFWSTESNVWVKTEDTAKGSMNGRVLMIKKKKRN